MKQNDYGHTLATRAFLLTACAALVLCPGPAQADFDNDGFEDLVSASTHKTVNGFLRAGMVMEVDGGSGGITTTDRLWNQDAGLAEVAEINDHFGRTLAIGDFDGDGYDDLAVGVMFEDVDGFDNAGVVHVIFGSGSGLHSAGDQLFNQADATTDSPVEADDRFGFSLAAADFNNDGYDDLAIGAATEDFQSETDAGAVVVLFGNSSGLSGTGSQWLTQYHADGESEPGDYFGYSLAAGDFDGDGFADLAIGAPGEDHDGVDAAGHVNVMYGSPSGLENSFYNDVWSQNRIGIADACETNDRFGATLAAADFNADGKDDLVIGVPLEDIESGATREDAGMIHVVYGSTYGLMSAGSQIMHQNNFNIIFSIAENGDNFGASLAAADFTGDGYADLVVGTPREDWVGDADAGVIQFIPGSSGGLDPDDAEGIMEDNLQSGAIMNGEEQFGFALAAGDINNDGYNDLAVSAPYEHLDAETDAGTVYVLYGQASGFNMLNDYFDHCTTGYSGGCESNDYFGLVLAAKPTKTSVSQAHIFSDGFESGNVSAWSGTAP